MKKNRLCLFRSSSGIAGALLPKINLLLLFCLLVSFNAFAEEGAQTVNLRLTFQNQSLKEVLNELEKQSDYSFMYDNNQIDVNRKVDLKINGNQSIDQIMDQLLAGTGIRWKLIDRHIMLMPAKADQDNRRVSGKVTDSKGEVLPGVSVQIKGTTNGTITGPDGKFQLTKLKNSDVLIFSFIGMKKQEVPVAGKTTLSIVLKDQTVGVNEVVVVGFGTQKKVNLTGSVGTIDHESLEARPVQNAAQMLEGISPGLNITQSGGSLEDTPSINIRGTTTIGDGSSGDPLVLIDGMEGDLNSVNPQDIESISVLKDAAASSIYGSRAPFGVILVTTKSGKDGKTVVNYNNSFRWNVPINMPEMMDSYTFALYFNDAEVNGGSSPYFDDEHLERILNYQNGDLTTSIPVSSSNSNYWADGYAEGNDNIDWYKALYRNSAFSEEHNLSVTGGNQKLQYYFSGNLLDQNGLMVFNQDDYKRYTTTLKVNAQLNSWASVKFSSRFSRTDYGRPSDLSSGFYQNLARQGWPTLPLYDPNGYLYSSPSPALGLRDGGRDETQEDNHYEQIQFTLEPVKGWKTFADFNYRITDQFRHWDVLETYNHDVEGNPYEYSSSSDVYEYALRTNYLNANIYTQYEKEVGDGNHFKLMGGFQTEQAKKRDFDATSYGVIVDEITAIDATSGTVDGDAVEPDVSGEYQQWQTCGFFGRLNYNYKGRYLFEGNLRYDGTSRFRKSQRWKLFPSASVGWNVARENFWAPFANMVSTLKLRASYGMLGNQNTDSWYPTYVTMPVGSSDGSWLVDGSQPNTSSAPSLVSSSMTWEKIRTWNIGIDFGLLKSHLSGTFDYYTRYTDDMIGPAPELPATLGTDVPKTNNTDLKTYGFELSFNWKDRLSNGLAYSIGLTLSDSQSEITRYPNTTGSLDSYRAGHKIGEIWGYETKGIAKTDEEMTEHLASLPDGGQDAIGSNWAAGDIMYTDLNGDGKIDNGSNTQSDHGDLKLIGNDTSRYLFGINLSADWKGVDIRAFFQGVLKRDYWQGSYYFWGADGQGIWWSTGFKQHEDYFRNDDSYSASILGTNTDSYYPRPVFDYKNQEQQTRYLQNAAYIRLKNLQIGYTIPKEFVSRYNINKLRFFVSGENLWTGTKLSKIFDPETVDGGNSSNGNAYPLSKVYSVGLNVNF